MPVEVTALTGITNEMLTGQRIDDPAVLDLLSSSHLVISHNAAFDRPKLETRLPAFAGKPWACTVPIWTGRPKASPPPDWTMSPSAWGSCSAGRTAARSTAWRASRC